MKQFLIDGMAWVMVRKNNAKSFGKALSISGLNQVVSSGTNFILSFYLVRDLPPIEFGLYGIGMAVSLFYASIGNALFLIPLVVHTPDKTPEDRLSYGARIFVFTTLFCFATIVIVVLVTVIGTPISNTISKYSKFILAIAFASVAYLLKDFFIRHSYNFRKENWALQINFIILISLVIFLSVLKLFNIALNAQLAILVYAASNALGGIAGFARTKISNFITLKIHSFMDVTDIYTTGTFAVVMTIAGSLRGSSLIFLAPLIVGTIAVAQINAARVFVSPVLLIIPVINNVLMPRMAHFIHQNKKVSFQMAKAV